MSEVLWKWDDDQMVSAQKLLEERSDSIHVFEIEAVEGVVVLCWGMKKIAAHLKGKVVEIADNTNTRNLELYMVVAEWDTTGLPISYCLLSTATSLEHHKRLKSIARWVDKDMAEIGAIMQIWPKAKVALWKTERTRNFHLLTALSYPSPNPTTRNTKVDHPVTRSDQMCRTRTRMQSSCTS